MRRQIRTPWGTNEDKLLRQLVKKYGVKRWDQVSEQFNQKFDENQRTSQQCKQRWSKMLDPKINKEEWKDYEIKEIFDPHKKFGNKWKQIGKKLNKRIDNDVKNQFLNAIRKGIRRICRYVRIGNSTQKIKNFKPKVISNIMCQLYQRQALTGESVEGIYEIVYELSRQNISNQIKQKLQTPQFLAILKIQINKIFAFAFLELINRKARLSQTRLPQSSVQFQSSPNSENLQVLELPTLKSQKSISFRMINQDENFEGLSQLSQFGFDINIIQSQINHRIGSGESNISFKSFMAYDSPQCEQKNLINKFFQQYLDENDNPDSQQDTNNHLKKQKQYKSIQENIQQE